MTPFIRNMDQRHNKMNRPIVDKNLIKRLKAILKGIHWDWDCDRNFELHISVSVCVVLFG